MNTKKIWLHINQHQPFTVSQVAIALDLDARQVRNAFHKWHKQKRIKQISHGIRNKVYSIVSDTTAPRLGQGNHSSKQHKSTNSRQLIWNALRILRKITLVDIQMVTDSGVSSARDYLNALERCGYVVGNASNGQLKTWKIVQNSGPIAPAHIRGQGVYDKNLNALIKYITTPTTITPKSISNHQQE